MRDALPLVFAGDELIAVADLWLDAGLVRSRRRAGVQGSVEQRPPCDLIGFVGHAPIC